MYAVHKKMLNIWSSESNVIMKMILNITYKLLTKINILYYICTISSIFILQIQFFQV